MYMKDATKMRDATKRMLSLLNTIAIVLILAACGASPVVETQVPNALSDMSYVLPEGVTAGVFDEFLGMGGGIALLDSDGAICGCIEVIKNASPVFEKGELVGVGLFANHSAFLSDFEAVASGAPCVSVEYAREVYDEETSKYVGEELLWYAFWAEEDCVPMYAIYLKEENFSRDALISMAHSVTFGDGAFTDADCSSQKRTEE